jgi:hypothetical protein
MRARWIAWTVAAVGFVVVAAGCMRRTITITTDPQGASVVLNDEQVGTSPVTVPFTWYGDYDVIIRKEGYETLSTHAVIERPWYQYPPIDLVAEAFIPTTIEDRHALHYDLAPSEPIDRAALLDRAEEMRDEALFAED